MRKGVVASNYPREDISLANHSSLTVQLKFPKDIMSDINQSALVCFGKDIFFHIYMCVVTLTDGVVFLRKYFLDIVKVVIMA